MFDGTIGYAELALLVGLPVVGLIAGYLVYWDAGRRGRRELAPYLGAATGGLFITGTVPGLLALTVTSDPVVHGFPTAIRVIPGLVLLGAYVRFR